jgi:hypothetical protein
MIGRHEGFKLVLYVRPLQVISAPSMPLAKTPTGRAALHQRDRNLSPRERQILVIADGTRSRSQLVELFGPPAEPQIDRLLQMGFLAGTANQLHHASGDASTLPDARRSLVATKIYCVDMLQLIRAPGAAEVMRSIQSSDSEAELMRNVKRCVVYLQENAAQSYASKVEARLAEIVPQQYLASFAS